MYKILLTCSLFTLQLTRPGSLLAQQGKADEKQIRAIHQAYFHTLVTQGSTVALEQYYSLDYSYIGVDGKLIDRAGLKARMNRNELAHFSLKDNLQRVSVYGTMAVLSGQSTSSVTDKGNQQTSVEGYTEVWIKGPASWHLVAEQITPQPKK